MAVSVLFVCLGNICRSPTAHGVFENMVKQQGHDQLISIDSAGTGSWHIGASPDERSAAVALQRGYDLSHLKARKVTKNDFSQFDYILAMDEQNLSDLRDMQPTNYTGHLSLFLDFAEADEHEVPDPYYGGPQGFDHVLDLVEQASEGLLEHILQSHR